MTTDQPTDMTAECENPTCTNPLAHSPNGPHDRHDNLVCGENYDHDLRIIGDSDDLVTYECRKCGAEIIEEQA